ncbi:hypothetical protein CYY_010337 [Polysphondylium violaceum]|uniref:Uncharacterized protein n=1 Tax=Polysphondylium violaceum TaxID=133409 RepID=A0A8J4UTX3_9MYCE|nr:hypothetical protein CYY_010337 [Polysphondylium violaceum]
MKSNPFPSQFSESNQGPTFTTDTNDLKEIIDLVFGKMVDPFIQEIYKSPTTIYRRLKVDLVLGILGLQKHHVGNVLKSQEPTQPINQAILKRTVEYVKPNLEEGQYKDGSNKHCTAIAWQAKKDKTVYMLTDIPEPIMKSQEKALLRKSTTKDSKNNYSINQLVTPRVIWVFLSQLRGLN